MTTMTVSQIRILLADKIIRSGLRLLLDQQPDFKVVAEASDGREAVELVSKHHPEVAVLDIGMPLLNGIEATQQIATKEPEPGARRGPQGGYTLRICSTSSVVSERAAREKNPASTAVARRHG